MTIEQALAWARGYPNPLIMRAVVVRKLLALAAGSGTAETSETSAQCEASQSGDATSVATPNLGREQDGESE